MNALQEEVRHLLDIVCSPSTMSDDQFHEAIHSVQKEFYAQKRNAVITEVASQV